MTGGLEVRGGPSPLEAYLVWADFLPPAKMVMGVIGQAGPLDQGQSPYGGSLMQQRQVTEVPRDSQVKYPLLVQRTTHRLLPMETLGNTYQARWACTPCHVEVED